MVGIQCFINAPIPHPEARIQRHVEHVEHAGLIGEGEGSHLLKLPLLENLA